MICQTCREAAIWAKSEHQWAKEEAALRHSRCKGCSCQHREDAEYLIDGYKESAHG